MLKEIIGKGNGRRYSVKKTLLNNLLARLGLSHSQELNVGGFRDIQVQYKRTIWETIWDRKSNWILGCTNLRTVSCTESNGLLKGNYNIREKA